MRCNKITELLDLYIDCELAEETRARVDRHLLRCSECAFEVRSLEQTRALLRDAFPSAESSPAFREKMAARLLEEFADQLRPEPIRSEGQWSLPFLRENA